MRTHANGTDGPSGDEGFTLIELLVVILIIGILAAIALPSFLGQSDKAKDSSAKTDARNLVSQVEACYAATQSYPACESGGTALDTAGLSGAVAYGSTTGYQIIAVSDSGNTFKITKSVTGYSRTCTTGGSTSGGCDNGSW